MDFSKTESQVNTTDFFQYLKSEQCDIQRICRSCLSVRTDVVMTSLLSEMATGSVGSILSSAVSIVVLPYEDFPQNICPECVNQLVKWCEFKEKCEKSDSLLKSVFKGGILKEEPLEVTTEYKCENDSIDDTEHYDDALGTDEKSSIINGQKKSDGKKIKGKRKYTKKAQISVKQKGHVQCHLCPETFPTASLLQEHASSNHDESGHGCPQCRERFEVLKDLELHITVHEPGPTWTCVECCKEIKSRSALRRHVVRHMQRKKHRCERCGKAFSERYALMRHHRVHSGLTAERRHLCVICGKRFTEAGRLREHMSSHSDARPFACVTCDKRFRSGRLLNSHARVHDSARPYQCRHCEKRFRHESTCKAHERVHTGERPYVCAACGKTFLQSGNLRLHMRTHSGERPYGCAWCARRFKSGSSLKAHERTHTGVKPYSCHICHKRFARSDLRTHLQRHSGERPFACGACDRRFYTAARLREHNAVVHAGEKPFECALCSQRLPTKSHLIKHIKSHQKKKKATVPKRKLLVLRVTDDTPYATAPDNQPIILSNTDSCGEVIISNDCTDITNVASEMTVSLANAIPLQVMEGSMENCVNFNQMNNVNLVTMSEGEMSIAATSSSVKLYQLDQSLVQIHSSGGQVTISKITSKMTANFE